METSSKAINLFLIKIFGFYLFWLVSDNFLIYHIDIYKDIWAFNYHIFLKALQWSSIGVLEAMGYELVHGYNSLAILGSYGVIIGNPCVGFGLTYGFASLIIAYPGPLKSKLWFIPLGALLILAINTTRVVFLAKQTFASGTFVQMEAHDLFNNLIYIVIFILWVVWVQFILKKKPATAA